MSDMPSEKGKDNYPPDGYYYITNEWRYPCTCTSQCTSSCNGSRCHCEACRIAYADHLSNNME